MKYDRQRGVSPDYMPCRYGKSKLLFRGPKRAATGGHIAVLGGTETYGKFIETPYPDLLEQLCNREVVNLGTVNAGVDVFLNDPTVLDICKTAACTVIELTGAHNISNRFYAVHPRRNDRFLRASTLMKTIYRDTDFTEFHFTRHLLQVLSETSVERFGMIVSEIKEAWVARMQKLIETIEGPVVLLWLSDHRPEAASVDPLGRGAPLLVDAGMVDALRGSVAGVIEVVADAEELAEGYEDMMFSDLDAPAAQELLGPVVHKRTALRLSEQLRQLLP